MSPLHQHVKDASDKLTESIEQGKESMLDAYAATSPAHAALLCRVSGRQLRDKTNETLFHSVRDSNAENAYTDRPPLVSSQEPDLAVRISIPRINTNEKADRTRHTCHNYQPGDSLAVSRNLRRGTALHGFQRDTVAGDRFGSISIFIWLELLGCKSKLLLFSFFVWQQTFKLTRSIQPHQTKFPTATLGKP
jgi:hypothetical protein